MTTTVQVKTSIPIDNSTHKDRQLWRDLSAYWILGLCNNYGYVVMLSAAHDIIARFGETDHNDNTDNDDPTIRHCNIISTGAILLADILPSLTIKIISPFLPFFINIRILTACLLQTAGFLLVAYAETEWMAISGVVFTSLSSGLGETSFLAYSSAFNKNVVSTWSSGTGGAGIIGSLSYAGLITLGVSSVNTMLIMLIVPIIEAFSFWVLLRKPINKIQPVQNNDTNTNNNDDGQQQGEPHNSENVENKIQQQNGYNADDVDDKPLMGFKAKLIYIPTLFKYMIPLTLVYLFEYFINQGLFELISFANIWLDQQGQYRWLQVDYQIGVFISRSSVNLFTIDKLWLLAVLQFINVIFMLFEVIFFFSPTIWIIFIVVLWEGLLGGSAYVNTFYKMTKEIPSTRKKFALGVVTLSDSIGIALAGVFSIPSHNALCGLPSPAR